MDFITIFSFVVCTDDMRTYYLPWPVAPHIRAEVKISRQRNISRLSFESCTEHLSLFPYWKKQINVYSAAAASVSRADISGEVRESKIWA